MLNVGCWTFLVLSAPRANAASTVLIVVGAGGEAEYSDNFSQWAANWQKASAAAGAVSTTFDAASKDTRERLQQALESAAKDAAEPLWLVLLGHGSFDGHEGKFNVAGDDIAASDIIAWLKPLQRPVVVICGFSASGAFLKPLSAPNRIVITSTRSGAESNYARLGGYLSETIASPAADLDKDGQTSLLEAWLAAAQRTADFYKNEERLATEHSLLDDNGDGFGTPSDWFQGVRVVKKSSDQRAPDGLRAHQVHLVPSPAERGLPAASRAERDSLERELARLRESKATLPAEEYYARLEALLLRLARVYREASSTPREPGS
jgi:hypothetical protein